MNVAGRTKETESLVKSLWSDITDAQMAYIFGEDYLQIAIGESIKHFRINYHLLPVHIISLDPK